MRADEFHQQQLEEQEYALWVIVKELRQAALKAPPESEITFVSGIVNTSFYVWDYTERKYKVTIEETK